MFQRVKDSMCWPVHDIQHLNFSLVLLNNLQTMLSFMSELLDSPFLLAYMIHQNSQEMTVKLYSFCLELIYCCSKGL